jgi:hypothetical protein
MGQSMLHDQRNVGEIVQVSSHICIAENSGDGMDDRGSGEPDARRTATNIFGIDLHTGEYYQCCILLLGCRKWITDDDRDDHPIRQ